VARGGGREDLVGEQGGGGGVEMSRRFVEHHDRPIGQSASRAG
jgi:hypothetical protein